MPRKPDFVAEDHTAELWKAIAELAKSEIHVGVLDNEKESLIGYLQETGSPAQNIPAQPFLVRGVEDTLKPIEREMKAAGQSLLNGDKKTANKALQQAGQIAVESVRELAPVDSGDLRDSIEYSVVPEGAD
jgi:hypothetical protein